MANTDQPAKEVVVVTGGAGFLGQHIVKQLIEQEDFPVAEIRVFDVAPLKWHKGLDVTDNTEITTKLCRGDLCCLTDVQKALKGATIVIHNASIVDVTSLPDEEKIYRVNVLGTKNIIKASIDNNIKTLVYTSSASVINKLGYYGSCKLEAERMVLQANNKELNNGGQLSSCALRLPALYGEGGTDVLGSLTRNIFGNVFIRSGSEETDCPSAYAGNMARAFVCAIRQLRDNADEADLTSLSRPIGVSADDISLAQNGQKDVAHGLSEEYATSNLDNNPAGRAIGVTDHTPVTSYCESLEPYLRMLKVRTSYFIIPFSVLYMLAFICEWISFLLQPLYTLKLPLSRAAVAHMHRLPPFDENEAKLYLKYEPIYTYRESVKRTFTYLEHCIKM